VSNGDDAAVDPGEDVHCSKDEDALDRSSEEENGRVVIRAASITWRSNAPMPAMLSVIFIDGDGELLPTLFPRGTITKQFHEEAGRRGGK